VAVELAALQFPQPGCARVGLPGKVPGLAEIAGRLQRFGDGGVPQPVRDSRAAVGVAASAEP